MKKKLMINKTLGVIDTIIALALTLWMLIHAIQNGNIHPLLFIGWIVSCLLQGIFWSNVKDITNPGWDEE